jgi:hypothetical protein
MSLPRTPSFQHKHLYLINNLSSLIRPSHHNKVDFSLKVKFHNLYSWQNTSRSSATIHAAIVMCNLLQFN